MDLTMFQIIGIDLPAHIPPVELKVTQLDRIEGMLKQLLGHLPLPEVD